MAIERYSAIPNFGVPIDDLAQIKTRDDIVGLFGAYNIDAQAIPIDTEDITPYYWRNPRFRYYMTRTSRLSPVDIEMLPTADDSESYIPLGDIVIEGIRRITVPTDQQVVMIAGPGPRFPGMICIHEAIIGD